MDRPHGVLMRLSGDLGTLTYCLNVHPTQSWAELRAAIEGPAAAVKARVSPEAPFAVGLRVSGAALAELADPAARAELKAILAEHGMRAVTVNGFPYGPFHGARVKEDVYRPDWREEERLRYTCDLADLMAEIAPPDARGGEAVTLSTVPGGFAPRTEGAAPEMADHMLRAAAHCARLERRTGVVVALALEPEPFCFLETIEQAVAFFGEHLFSEGAVRRMAKLADLAEDEARAALPRHLGLCYDVCHAAVEFEDPAASLRALREAGIPVHKLQLSAALRVPAVTPEARAALAAFDEGTYLHQVVSRGQDGLRRLPDLGPALARGADADGEEWRVHFHVPLFLRDLGAFESTQAFLAEVLALHTRASVSPHLEVETYTWDVLPGALRQGSIEEAVARELGWVRERLAA